MSLFDYKGRNIEGEEVFGVIDAINEDLASDLLEDQGVMVTSLSERKSSFLAKYLNISFEEKVKHRDIVIFSRQLAVMIGATIPIVKALRTLIKQTESIRLKSIVSGIADDVESGSKLSISMSKYPDVFNDFFINMVKSGETSGRLGDVLNFLADQQEKDYDMMSKVKGKMMYPIFILGFLIVVFVFMMVYVVPKITDMVRGVGGDLPLPTRMLIGTSDFFVNYWWLLVILSVGVFVGLKYYLKSEKGKMQRDMLILRVPLFGSFFQKVYIVRFTRGLSTLIVGKVPLTIGLGVVAGVVQNTVYKDLINKTIREVEDGNSISSVFFKSKEVPTMVSNMLIVGEQTGRLEEVLLKLTEFYSREIDTIIESITSLIEPIIFIILGAGVFVIVSAIMLPMFNMANQI